MPVRELTLPELVKAFEWCLERSDKVTETGDIFMLCVPGDGILNHVAAMSSRKSVAHHQLSLGDDKLEVGQKLLRVTLHFDVAEQGEVTQVLPQFNWKGKTDEPT